MNVRSGANRVRHKLSQVNFGSVYIMNVLNVLTSNVKLFLKDKILLIRQAHLFYLILLIRMLTFMRPYN